jgi:hypothetical protein
MDDGPDSTYITLACVILVTRRTGLYGPRRVYRAGPFFGSAAIAVLE